MLEDSELRVPDDFSEVDLCGEIISNGVLAYEKDGEKFYEMLVKVEDEYERMTICSVTFSENLSKNVKVSKGERIYVKGRLRSYCDRENGTKLRLTVFAQNLFYGGESDDRRVMFIGTLCEPISIQTTDKGKTIVRALVVKEREGGCSDYIPLVTDDYNLEELKSLAVGDKIAVFGGIESVRHKEKTSDTEMLIRTETANEVFVSGFTKL